MTTTNQGSLEQLLESGQFDDSTSIEDLEAALSGAKSPKDDDAGQGAASDDSDDGAATAGKAADSADSGKGQQADPPAEAVAAKQGDADGHADHSDPSDFAKHPLYGTLKGTRQKLSEAKNQLRTREEENRKLKEQLDSLSAKVATQGTQATQQVQDAADAAGMVDGSGQPIDVATIDIDKLREDYDGPIVDAIAQLQKLVTHQHGVIKDLRGREDTRQRTQEQINADSLRADIDAVPQLAEWEADEESPMWEAAVGVDKALRDKPEWQGRSRVERFREVVKLLGGNAGQAAANSKQGDDKVNDAITRATRRAAPTSLSELPSGTAAAQSEEELLGNLDITQLASKLGSMNKEQQDALLARLG